mgnify:CR=1 FL=1|tara:strand:+ start:311 stop:940 length:630 start_codon:yes stop_codon:yes gene_type:complete
MSYFNNQHQPQRGIIPMTTSAGRTWLVSAADAKEHLRIGHTDDDTYITRLTKAAQLVCEKLTGMVFTPCDFILECDNWDQTKEIPEISLIKTIDYIKYMDDADPSAQQTWADTNYYLSYFSQRSRIALVDGSSYPNLRDGIGNIEIKFGAKPNWSGNTLTALSEVATQAVLITIADMYENRQSVIVGRIASSIPKTAQYLLDTLKIQTL